MEILAVPSFPSAPEPMGLGGQGTHLGFSRGSGSPRARPTGFFSASSAVNKCSSASTLPCRGKAGSRAWSRGQVQEGKYGRGTLALQPSPTHCPP